jgi:tRNA pseudouridine38-40 synthase
VLTWKLTIEYDGSRYSGWQEQSNARTVMGELRAAAEQALGCGVELHGAGRTDAGVHAAAQVAHLRADRRASTDRLLRQMNEKLPTDIAVLAVEEAPDSFHARHDATSRSYVYQISRRKMAFSKRYVWWIREPLDVEAMQRAAAFLPGRHDFICFRAADEKRPDESTIVHVEEAGIEDDGELIVFRIQASHFLWRMVRRLAGALVKVGLGELSVEAFAELVDAKPAERYPIAEWTAPSAGLFLEKISYAPKPARTTRDAAHGRAPRGERRDTRRPR